MRYLCIYFTFLMTFHTNTWAAEPKDLNIKQINDNEFILSQSGKCSDSSFKDSSFDAACLVVSNPNLETKSCTINFFDQNKQRFLSHKLKLLEQSKVIEFTVKDSRRLTAYRKKINNKDNWIHSFLINPYLSLAKSQNIKEQEYIVIDENGLSEVKTLNN